MPRIVYDEPAQINPGMAVADLATGLFGGLLQGQMAEQQRARSQEEAAFGNPYERRRRALTWQTLPENVRSAPNSALYQQLIMSGADPMSVMKAHQELDTDPVYGDTKTQKARMADLEAARKGGLLDPNDTAGQEAIRRGELTLGQLIKNRESAKLSKQEKDDAAATRRADKDQERAEKKGRAGQMQRALGVGLPGDPVPAVIPTGGAGGAVVAQVPTTPGVQFEDPADVEAAARIGDARKAEASREKDRAHDNELNDRKAETQRVLAEAKAKGVTLSEDEMDLAAQHLNTANDPKAPESARNRSKVWLRAHKLWGEGDMAYKPSAMQSAEHSDARARLAALQDRAKAFDGREGPDAMLGYAQANGIKLDTNAKGRPVLTAATEAAIRKHLADAIKAAEAAVDASRQGLGPNTGPTKTPTVVTDEVRKISAEEKKRMLQGR